MRQFHLVTLLAAFANVSCCSVLPLRQSDHGVKGDQLDELVHTIDDRPDILHFDYTPSVYKLIEVGDAAIPRMLDLMLSDKAETRLHAQRVIEGITLEQHSFVRGQGWKDPKGEERWLAFWRSLGDLDYQSTQEEREKAVKLWRQWLASRKG